MDKLPASIVRSMSAIDGVDGSSTSIQVPKRSVI
jgi:hypothetical protein